MIPRQQRQCEWSLDRPALESLQLVKLNRLLKAIVPASPLYRQKLGTTAPQLELLAELAELPMTTKEDLVHAEANDQWRTAADEAYVRFHQTSGSSGRPLTVLDTADDWAWWIATWQHVLDAAQISAGDTALLAFSFGPFIGFWSALDALTARGVRAITAGGMTSAARIDLIERTGATRLFCTPSYALHLAEEGRERGIDVANLSIETLVVAGEPGGSLPAVRNRIETAWGAQVVDHAGATEVGPWGFGDANSTDEPGLRLIESEFIPEFLSVETGKPAEQNELSHLVLTPLGRAGSPVVRYRTGDLVRPQWTDSGTCRFVRLGGGVISRADDMMVIRGVNIYPTAIEQILHGFPEIVEHRLIVRKRGEMDELVVEVEDRLEQPTRIADELRLRLGLKVEVRLATAMSLPRSEGKSRRFVDLR